MNIDTVIYFVFAELESKNFDENLQNQIAVATEEIFVNIANYAYAPQTGTVRLCVEVSQGSGELRITFEDSGKPYNPLDNPEPDLSLPVEERSIGGLGVFMVKNIMDTVQYRHENGINQLTMTKVRNI